jgi:hypothetical protein
MQICSALELESSVLVSKRERKERVLAVETAEFAAENRRLPIWLIILYLGMGAWALWGLIHLLAA